MGNCFCRGNFSIYRITSHGKPDSPKAQRKAIKYDGKDDTELPTFSKKVEDLRRDDGTDPLVSFTFDELKKITSNFRQDRLLGIGGFGRVYKGFISKDLRNGIRPLQVAVKVHDGIRSFQGHREWLAEVIYLGQLSHPNLVRLIGYCCEEDQRVLIYEYMARGSVENNLFSTSTSFESERFMTATFLGSKRSEKLYIFCGSFDDCPDHLFVNHGA